MRGEVIAALLLAPAFVSAQQSPDEDASRLDSLLAVSSVDSVIDGLDDRFIGHFFMLLPDLTSDELAVLTTAAARAFEASLVRDDMANALAGKAAPGVVGAVLTMRRFGAEVEMRRLAGAHEPVQSLGDFAAGLGGAERARLQLMARLVEARGSGDFDLLLDEAIRRAAHDLAASLGRDVGAFEPIADDAFNVAYRQNTVALAVESLYFLDAVSDELVEAVITEYSGEAGRWYVDAMSSAMLEAVQGAGRRMASMTVVAHEEPAVELSEAEAGLPCRAQACGFVVDWAGTEPSATNRRFGTARDLEYRVSEGLVRDGYQLTTGIVAEGLTLRLRGRTRRARCDFIGGTDTGTCIAIDQVRVDFLGTHPGFDTSDAFIVRNRCGADGVMDVDGIAALVALRIHYALTTYPGDDRKPPNC